MKGHANGPERLSMAPNLRRIIAVAVVVGLIAGAIAFTLWASRPRAHSDSEAAAWALDHMWCAQEQAMGHAFGSREAACIQMSQRSHARRNDIQDLGGFVPSTMLDDGVAFSMDRGILTTKHGGSQEYWFEVIWHDAAQQEIVALVTVLEQPFLQFDTEYPHVLLIRTSVRCVPVGPPCFSFATIGSSDHNYNDVSLSKFAPWAVERQGDDLSVSLMGGGSWVLPSPAAH